MTDFDRDAEPLFGIPVILSEWLPKDTVIICGQPNGKPNGKPYLVIMGSGAMLAEPQKVPSTSIILRMRDWVVRVFRTLSRSASRVIGK